MSKGGDDNASQSRRQRSRIAVTKTDVLRACQKSFLSKVDRALSLIQSTEETGVIGVSFSGGIDSTVLLDLVKRIYSNAPAGFFDSGCELKQTYAIVDFYQVKTIYPKKSLPEMCRYGGYWEHPHPIEPGYPFDFLYELVVEPSYRFAKEEDFNIHAIGLLASESKTRGFVLAQKGEFYFTKYDQSYHLCPLLRWTKDDIWAYVASRELEYNSAYDEMTKLKIPRSEQRISTILGSSFARNGRYSYFRQLDPDLWNRLCVDFPKIRRFT